MTDDHFIPDRLASIAEQERAALASELAPDMMPWSPWDDDLFDDPAPTGDELRDEIAWMDWTDQLAQSDVPVSDEFDPVPATDTPSPTDKPSLYGADPVPTPDNTTGVLNLIDEFCRVTVPALAETLSPDFDGLATLLQLLRRAQAQLGWALEVVEDAAIACMSSKELTVDGVGAVTRRTVTSRKQWDHAGLVAVLTSRIADDPGIKYDEATGDSLSPTQQVEAVLARFLESATPSWKLNGLRKWAVDPEDYVTTTYGRRSLQLPPVLAWADSVTAGGDE